MTTVPIHDSSKTTQAALVTGSAIRLGKHIALALAQYGFDIALHYNSSETEAENTAAEIRQHNVKCHLFQMDLTQTNQIKPLMAQVLEVFPHLSVLVNGAAGYTQAHIATTTPDIFDFQFALNLRAPFFLMQAYAELCGRGNVINIIDNKIAFNQHQYAAYLLSKKAVAEFTKLAALEFSPKVRVNGVAPGVVLPATSRSEEYLEWRKQGIPLKRKGKLQNISQAIISILENDFMTGQILFIDGGESLTNVGLNAGDYDQTKV
jgi:pteridine reductase